MTDLAKLGVEITSKGIDETTAKMVNMTKAANDVETSTEHASEGVKRQAKELEMLRSKYDPVYASSKRYEKELNEINRAHALGAINAKTQEKAISSLNNRYQTAAVVAQKFGKIQKSNGLQTANLAAQLNDIGVTLAMGQSPLQIALQQGTQINQVIGQKGAAGAVGALAGAFTSLINPVSLATIGIIGLGGYAVQWLFDVKSETEKTTTALEGLEGAVSEYVRAAKDANRDNMELAESYGHLADEAERFRDVNSETAEVLARRAVSNSIKEITDGISEISLKSIDAYEKLGGVTSRGSIALKGRAAAALTAISGLAGGLGVAEDKALDFVKAMDDLRQAKTIEEQVQQAEILRTKFVEAIGGLENMNNEAAKFLQELDQVTNSAFNVVEASSQIPDTLAVATQQAKELARALGAAESAADGAVKSTQDKIVDLKTQISLRGKPVELAGTQAGIKFDRQTELPANADPELIQKLEERRAKTVALSQEQAKLEEQVRLLNEQDRESLKISRQSSKSAKSRAKKAEREAKKYREARERNSEYIANIEREVDILGMSGAARRDNLIVFADEKAIRQEIKRLGKDATQEEIDRVRELITERRGLLNSLEAEKERNQEMRDLAGGFISDLRSGLEETGDFWKSFGDAALNALDKITDKLLNEVLDALFQVNNAGSSGGGGGIGGIIGSIFGGFGGGGGGVSAGFSAASSFLPSALFADGGYTGNLGTSQPAGIVHGQEFVNNASSTRRFRPELEAMNRGINPFNARPANNNGGNQKVEVELSMTPDVEARIMKNTNNNTIRFVQKSAPKIVDAAVSQSTRNLADGTNDSVLQERHGLSTQASAIG